MFTPRQIEIINIIQVYYKTHGVSPRGSDVNIKSLAKRTFGSWNNALDAAKVPVNRRHGQTEQRFSKSLNKCSVCSKDIINIRFKKYCQDCSKSSINTNSMYSQRRRGLARKLAAIQSKGGRCQNCGYNKNIAALVFHHTDDKKFGLDMRAFSNRSSEILNEELEKCQLLCHNCHSEIHHPDLSGIL